MTKKTTDSGKVGGAVARRAALAVVPVVPDIRSWDEQVQLCVRLFLACSNLLRGVLRRLPLANLRFADRQKLRRALSRLDADLSLARTALGTEDGRQADEQNVTALPPVTGGR